MHGKPFTQKPALTHPPTGGTARFSSPVNVDDFLKIISVFGLGADDLRQAGPPAVVLARAEELEAHARAVECRLVALDELTAGDREAGAVGAER